MVADEVFLTVSSHTVSPVCFLPDLPVLLLALIEGTDELHLFACLFLLSGVKSGWFGGFDNSAALFPIPCLFLKIKLRGRSSCSCFPCECTGDLFVRRNQYAFILQKELGTSPWINMGFKLNIQMYVH